MGVVSFLRGIVDLKYAGKDLVKKQIEAYYKEKNLDPDQPQHVHLARAWLSRQAFWGDDVTLPEEINRAYSETLQCACVAHPDCAEAFGLFILHQERSDIVKEYPEFSVRFKQLIKPVMEAVDSSMLKMLYGRFNPDMDEEIMRIIEEMFNFSKPLEWKRQKKK
jgi:hypothetical protein